MDKIPTLFMRGGSEVSFNVIPEIAPGCEWVAAGEGIMTIKIDGQCVKVERENMNHLPKLWKRIKMENISGTGWRWAECWRTNPTDAPLFDALDDTSYVGEAIYEAYGPGIGGNHQRSEGPGLVKIEPMGAELIIATTQTDIKRGPHVTVQQLYDSLWLELSKSEIEGIVFILEDSSLRPLARAKIKRSDFGLPWPIPIVIPENPVMQPTNENPVTALVVTH